jgi:hypothetical protein
MGIKREQENGSQTVQISFGTLFEVLTEPDRIDVIVEVGENNWFEAARVVQDETGYRLASYPGTGGPEVFGKLVGQLTADQVIEAAKKHALDHGYELPDESLKYFLTNSQVPPRILNIK